MTTRQKLHNNIMKYWFNCIYKSGKHDYLVNDLFERITKRYGIDYEMFGDWDTTIEQLTNSQLRIFLEELKKSGILEMEVKK